MSGYKFYLHVLYSCINVSVITNECLITGVHSNGGDVPCGDGEKAKVHWYVVEFANLFVIIGQLSNLRVQVPCLQQLN